MLLKIVGIILMALGVIVLKFFPGDLSHQKPEMTMIGILIGILFFLIGIVLLIFM